MDDKIIALYSQSGNGKLVATELGITTYRVYKTLRLHGIEPKKIGGKEKIPVSRMIEMYQSGQSTFQIAKALNMNQSSIIERLQTSGIELRSKQDALELCGHTKIKRSHEQDVVRMYQEGLSYRDIALQYDVTMRVISRVLKKHNIEPRDNFGSNNPAWRGGKVPLNKLIRNSQKYTDFVKHIMQSRDYTCELTGERGGKLNVHHIRPFSQLVDEFMKTHGHVSDREQLNAAIESYGPFWDESNVLLIAELEHKKIHSN